MINYERLFQNRYWLPKFGEIALASLQIALISGLLLIPGFQSAAQPFKSVSAIVNSSLFGHFLHSCHAYAGDVFLIATLLHLIEYLLKHAFNAYHWKSWGWLVILLLSALWVVFSGFLSLGSLESFDATQILKNILNATGEAGRALTRFLLLSSQNHSVLTILLHHVATFSLLTVILTYVHLKRLKADAYVFYYSLVLITFLAVAFPASIGTSPAAELAVVKGPWYFRGLQEMLAWLPVWLAGIGLPLVVLALLALLPVVKKSQRVVLNLFWLLLLFYFAESLVATFFRGAGWQLSVW